VNDPAGVELREADDRGREVRRVGRSAALVVDDAERVCPFADLIADRLDEVRAVHAEEPRRPDDQVFLRVRRRLLAEELRTAVGGEGMRRVVDLVRRSLAAVEDEVGRDLDQQRVHLVCRVGEELDRRAVDRVGEPLVLFRRVDLRIGGGVDDDRRLFGGDRARDGALVGDVEIRLRQRHERFVAFGERVAEVVSDHSPRAGNQPAMVHFCLTCTFTPRGSQGAIMPRAEKA